MAGYAFHAAVLDALGQETGFDARSSEIMIGTSAGSVMAALLRGNISAGQVHNRLNGNGPGSDLAALRLLSGRSPKAIPRIWSGPSSPGMLLNELRRGRRLRPMHLVTAILPRGRLDLSAVTGPVDQLHGEDWPERGLWIPATELKTGRRTVFGRDKQPRVADAVTASAALPGFFAPATVDGETYVDGGVGSPFNADLIIEWSHEPLDLVIVLAPLSLDELNRAAPVASLARSLPRRRLRSEIRRIEDHGTATLVVQPDRAVAKAMGLNPMDPKRIEAILGRSDELLRRQLVATSSRVVDLLEKAAADAEPFTNAVYPSS